jgi:uncharacterized MAPEG superfamily protein
MTTDLYCLLALALWSIVLNHVPAIARVSAAQSPIAWGLGNRDTVPEVKPWVGRADRAQRNHHDNLAMIMAVILIAQVSGQADAVTASASIALLGCRVLHGITYIFGIPTLRSLSYAASIGALGVIVWRILT